MKGCTYDPVDDTFVSATDHTWVKTQTLPPTCTEKGTQFYKCSVCGATRTESIPALVAPVQTSTASSESNTSAPATTATPQVQSGHAAVYFTCTACGYHNWTATEGGYACDHCGAVTTQDLSA